MTAMSAAPQLRLRVSPDTLERAAAGRETDTIVVTTRLRLSVGAKYDVKLELDGAVRGLGCVEAVWIKPGTGGSAISVGLRLVSATRTMEGSSTPKLTLQDPAVAAAKSVAPSGAPVNEPARAPVPVAPTEPPREPALTLQDLAPLEGHAQPSPDERRIDTRFDMHVEVGLQSDNAFYTGLTQDIGQGGLFVATHDVRRIGERLTVKFTLPHREQAIVADTEVRWVRDRSTKDAPQGMGLRFLHLSPDNEAAITEFLATNDSLFFDDE